MLYVPLMEEASSHSHHMLSEEQNLFTKPILFLMVDVGKFMLIKAWESSQDNTGIKTEGFGLGELFRE